MLLIERILPFILIRSRYEECIYKMGVVIYFNTPYLYLWTMSPSHLERCSIVFRTLIPFSFFQACVWHSLCPIVRLPPDFSNFISMARSASLPVLVWVLISSVPICSFALWPDPPPKSCGTPHEEVHNLNSLSRLESTIERDSKVSFHPPFGHTQSR